MAGVERIVGEFIELGFKIVRNKINNGTSIKVTCDKCNSRGPHKFSKIKPRMGGAAYSIGKKIYKCKKCRAYIDVKGRIVT